MQQVTVKKTDLLERITKNRDNHRAIFEEALVGYREAVIKELDKMLDDAKNGLTIKRAVGLVEPTDYTKEYDRVIDMLTLSVDDEITLDVMSFARYMRDEWEWKNQWLHSNANYSAGAASQLV